MKDKNKYSDYTKINLKIEKIYDKKMSDFLNMKTLLLLKYPKRTNFIRYKLSLYKCPNFLSSNKSLLILSFFGLFHLSLF